MAQQVIRDSWDRNLQPTAKELARREEARKVKERSEKW